MVDKVTEAFTDALINTPMLCEDTLIKVVFAHIKDWADEEATVNETNDAWDRADEALRCLLERVQEHVNEEIDNEYDNVKSTFKVRAQSGVIMELEVEAYTEEEALQIAKDTDGSEYSEVPNSEYWNNIGVKSEAF